MVFISCMVWAERFGLAMKQAVQSHIVVPLYRDLTAESLLQQRATRPNGDTFWKHSALLHAAVVGSLVVLDGVDRLAPGTLECLHRFFTDREIDLPDGTRMLPEWKCRQLAARDGLLLLPDGALDRGQLLEQCGIHVVHPAFRVIALASVGTAADGNRWFTEEYVSMFSFIVMDDLSTADLRDLLDKHPCSALGASASASSSSSTTTAATQGIDPGAGGVAVREALLECAAALADDENRDGELATCPHLSSRQIVRIYGRVMDSSVVAPSQRFRCLADQLMGTLMVKFMPQMNGAAVIDVIEKCGVSCRHAPNGTPLVAQHDYHFVQSESAGGGGVVVAQTPPPPSSTVPRVSDARELVSGLHIATLWQQRLDADSRLLVPEIEFFENARQLAHLRDVARDLERGEHVLLVGNQGVGKNKIADYLLQLIQAPREYVRSVCVFFFSSFSNLFRRRIERSELEFVLLHVLSIPTITMFLTTRRQVCTAAP